MHIKKHLVRLLSGETTENEPFGIFLISVRNLSLAAATAAIINFLTVYCFDITLVDAIHFKAVFKEPVCSWKLPFCIALAMILTLLLTRPWQDKYLQRLSLFEKIMRPALLLWLFNTGEFPGISAAILIISLVVFQFAGNMKFKLPELPDKYAAAAAISGWMILTAWGYFLQVRAFDTLSFIWGDWNIYAEHYQHLLSGNPRFIEWCSGAGHWNFGVNLIMTGALKIWYAPDIIFLINSLCIASTVPLGYWLSRKCCLSNWQSLIFLPLTFFNPVLSNQYLCLFYGFHPIVFFIPLLFGIFIAGEYKKFHIMRLLILLSLLIQETVCIFWAGYAIYLLCRKRWKNGLLLLTAMVGAFLFFSKVIIPAAHYQENYAQLFHYAHLGNSLGEVVLSPLFRPAQFWTTLFERSSFCFGAALFVPLFFGIIFKPAMLISLLPIFAGVILQGSPDVKSVALQYGLECTIFSMIVMVLNWKQIAPELRRPSAFAVLAATVLSGFLLGMIPGGKGQFQRLMKRPVASELINFSDKAARGANRIVATKRLRGQFQFSHPNVFFTDGYQPGDAILLDLHDTEFEDNLALDRFRRKIATDKRVVPVSYFYWEYHTIVMYKVLPHAVTLPQIPWLRPVAKDIFTKHGGILIPQKNDEYELRRTRRNGQNVYRLYLLKALDHDLEFSVWQREKSGKEVEAKVLFGNGIFPAYSVKPGTMFEFAVPGEATDEIKINVYKKTVM